MTASPLAPLPVPVRPRHGETAASYIRRLARANHLRPSYLRSLLCSHPQSGVRADQLAAVSGRTARALEHTLAGLGQRPGSGPPQILRPPNLRQAAQPGTLAGIRRDAAADPAVPVRQLAARHRVPRRTVLQALTPPGAPPGTPHPPWPAPPLAPLRPLIDTWLAEKPSMPAHQIWERLLDEHDAEISYLSVNAYVTRHRAKLNGKTGLLHGRRSRSPARQAMIVCQSTRPVQDRGSGRADLFGAGHICR
jgi:hypothetical protein